MSQENNSKKILVISDTIIFPLDRGNRKRVYNLINMMRGEGHEVDFLYLATYDEEDPKETREFIGEEHFITFRNKKRSLPVFLKRKVRKALELLHVPGLMFKYFTIDERITPDIDDFMRNIYAQGNYDIAWAEYVYMSRALLTAPENVTRVIDSVNAYTFKRQMYESVGYYNYEFALKKNTEAAGLSRGDYVVAIQEAEADFFRSILPASVNVVTIGENMPAGTPRVTASDIVLFVGSHYVVNQEGVKQFIRDILPELKKLNVPFRLQFAGSICKHISDSEEYEKLGYVDDVDATYNTARLVINPVNAGTGLNIKTIEAVSKAIPLVSHEIGVRGLRPSKPFALVAESPKEYAEAIARVLEDDKLAMELSQNAADYMKEYQLGNINAFHEILDYERGKK